MVARARHLLPKLPLARCLLAAGALLLAMPTALAASNDDPVTVYRCTGDDGRLTLRDTPCRPGQRQQTLQMQRPQDPPPAATPPVPDPPANPPAPTSAPAPATRVVVIQPPQPVYECITPDGERYTSDNGDGNPRWVPLWTLGYPAYYPAPRPRPPHRDPPDNDNRHLYNDLVFDGIGRPTPEPPRSRPGPPRLPPAVGLARTPGTWVRDRCHRLPQGQVCQRLRDRHWELRRDYHSALQSERKRIDAEQHAIASRLARDC